jgi:hypothetical protein
MGGSPVSTPTRGGSPGEPAPCTAPERNHPTVAPQPVWPDGVTGRPEIADLQKRLERLRHLRELKVRLLPDPSSAAVRWLHDPAGFAQEAIAWSPGQGLTAYQAEILQQLPLRQRLAVRGPHGLGKTAVNAIAVLWFAFTRDAAGVDWKAATTAGAWRQLEHYLWPEIHKWARRLRWDLLNRPPLNERTELLALKLKLRHGAAFAVASDQPSLIEGVHADSVLYVFDESKSISADLFDAAEGAFSAARADGLPEAFAIAQSTPGEPAGRFYELHKRQPGLEDWWVRHVTLEEAVAAGRVAGDWAVQRGRQWGTRSALYLNRVLGEFAAADEDGVIPLAWVEAAVDRWRTWDEHGRPDGDRPRVVGADIARSGADQTVLALRAGWVIEELRHTHLEDTMMTTGRIRGLLDARHGMRASVDVIGIGAGVVDRLREQRYPVEAFNAAEGTRRKDRSGELGFTNVRSAAWWAMRELLDPATGDPVALPPDDLLIGDLTAPHWRVLSGGRIQIESKDDLRKRLGRSTDTGDAVVQAFWSRSRVGSFAGMHMATTRIWSG